MVLAGAAGSALAGCSSSSTSSSTTAAGSSSKPGRRRRHPVRGGSLTIGLVAEIDGFYPPNNHWDTNGYIYANCLYDPLMAIAADGTIQPYLCRVVHPERHLRHVDDDAAPDVKFNDGSALTAQVVVSNYNALKASLLTGQALTQVTSVTAPDAMTVVFTLQGPNPGFAAGLTTQVGYVVGQAMIDQANAKVGQPHAGGHRAVRLPGAGSRTTTSPPPATRTTGGPGSPTSTRSPSGPSPTPSSARRRSRPAAST